MEEVGRGGVFEATLAAFGDGCAERAGYDDLGIRMLVHVSNSLGSPKPS